MSGSRTEERVENKNSLSAVASRLILAGMQRRGRISSRIKDWIGEKGLRGIQRAEAKVDFAVRTMVGCRAAAGRRPSSVEPVRTAAASTAPTSGRVPFTGLVVVPTDSNRSFTHPTLLFLALLRARLRPEQFTSKFLSKSFQYNHKISSRS